ncbi:hypothetical protein [Reyranella sp.]|uniref:hypothetical protein n=1 Tax=Reyranella sp. TaxID=1929291 RepID=UPI00120B8DF4|nr:hypothetical protein [Reyranella sp.]TAJ84558.1 MAG: hypothetical protein EPO50_17875 [Reyranella sp.]
MANELTWLKDGGAWKQATNIHIKDAGAWKPVKGIWVHDGGGWKKVYFKSFRFNHTYSTDTASPSMATLATSLGWNGADPVVGNVTVNANLYSTSTGVAAFYCHGLPAGSVIKLTVNGGRTIGGRGGQGGNGVAGSNGETGGLAMYVRNTLNVVNNGVIAGGGGGGGVGADYIDWGTNTFIGGSGGGGGRGGGAGGGGINNAGYIPGVPGNSGSFAAAGSGGAGVAHAIGGEEGSVVWIQGGSGGAGGDWAQTGSSGAAASNGGAGGSGGLGGWAVDGNSFVTWLTPGSRFGHLGN